MCLGLLLLGCGWGGMEMEWGFKHYYIYKKKQKQVKNLDNINKSYSTTRYI